MTTKLNGPLEARLDAALRQISEVDTYRSKDCIEYLRLEELHDLGLLRCINDQGSLSEYTLSEKGKAYLANPLLDLSLAGIERELATMAETLLRKAMLRAELNEAMLRAELNRRKMLLAQEEFHVKQGMVRRGTLSFYNLVFHIQDNSALDSLKERFEYAMENGYTFEVYDILDREDHKDFIFTLRFFPGPEVRK
jgi:hypothetical protein